MNARLRRTSVAVVLLVVGAAATLGIEHWALPRFLPAHAGDAYAERPAEPADAPEAPAVALVKTAAVEVTSMRPDIRGFGVVALKPGALSTLGSPAEIIVRRVLVTSGQSVAGGDPLLEITPTPDAALQFSLAKQAADSTHALVETARARLGMSLGTRQELQTAEAGAAEAQERFHRLTSAPMPPDGVVRAIGPGVVQSVRVQAGTISPAGSPLLEIAAAGGLGAQIGLEPAVAASTSNGTRVHVQPVAPGSGNLTDSYDGVIVLVGSSLNPLTRLVDVLVDLSPEVRLPVGLSVEAVIDAPATDALSVPRRAVLPTDEGDVLFTVTDGKAVRHVVKVGLRGRERVQVLAGVGAGESVVVLGQAELEDGMSVRLVEEPASTETREGQR